ncbi:MAG TPA: hypothetical protein VFS13_00265 [Steroidobacteraceae bacterium]|nr:hypothetical protein [Steroidobacteraceae bacterium]
MDIAGSCHCGNISFSLAWPDEAEIPARSCGCTFCVKHGGVWTSNPRATLRARITEAGMVARYAFGTETAQFLLCARCGVAPLVTSRIGEMTYAVVNVNTFDDFDRVRLRVQPASFEGEDVQSRLDRRRRHWIADVVLSEGRS